MRSSRAKNPNSLVLVGVFFLVLLVMGGAFWLLSDDAPAGDQGADVVRGPRVERATPMAAPEMPEVVAEPEQIAVPNPLRPALSDETYVAAAGVPRCMISGRVVNTLNQGVPGCEITLFKGNSMLLNVNFAGTRQILDVRTISGPDGSFEMPRVPVGRNYVLVGEHGDYAKTEIAGLQVPPNRDLTNVVLRMEQGATVNGKVSTVGGVPIAEARVELFDAIATVQLPPDQRRPWKIVFTDNNGDYVFEHVSASSLRVRVLAEAYESQSRMLSFALDARASDRTVDFNLKDGISMPGRVLDERGRGIPGVRIEATSLTKDYQGTAVAQSGRDGTFVLDGMGDDQYYQVRATATGYSNKVNPKVHVDDGELLIEMEQRLFVEGQVVDYAGSPIRGYSLTLMRAAEGRDPLFLNDTRNFSSADGRFVFDNLDPGSYALEARAAGLAPSWSESFAVVRTDEPPPQVIIEMGRGGTLRGTVVTSHGEAVSGAIVRLNPNNHLDSPIQGIFAALGGTKQRKVETRSDESGAFLLANVRAGTYQVACSHPGSAPATVNDVLIVDDEVGSNPPLDVGLPAGSTIAGLAMDANSRIIPFCEVQVTNKKSAFLDAATTDAEGRFNFGNLAEGTYTLMVKPDRIGSKPINPLMKLMYAQRSQREVFVSAGQTVSDVELYLPDISQGN